MRAFLSIYLNWFKFHLYDRKLGYKIFCTFSVNEKIQPISLKGDLKTSKYGL